MNSDTHDKTEHQRILAHAFDVAWSEFLRADRPNGDLTTYRRSLATKIVALSRAGVIDTTELSDAALTHLRGLAQGDSRYPHHATREPVAREMILTRDAPNLAPRTRLKPASRLRRKLMQKHN